MSKLFNDTAEKHTEYRDTLQALINIAHCIDSYSDCLSAIEPPENHNWDSLREILAYRNAQLLKNP